MANTKRHKILIHAVFETLIINDDPAYARSIAERLFEDEVTSKAEMFSVQVERVEVQPDAKLLTNPINPR